MHVQEARPRVKRSLDVALKMGRVVEFAFGDELCCWVPWYCRAGRQHVDFVLPDQVDDLRVGEVVDAYVLVEGADDPFAQGGAILPRPAEAEDFAAFAVVQFEHLDRQHRHPTTAIDRDENRCR